jgi:hypothetical protein
MSNTPKPDIAASTSRKITRERSSSGPTASHRENEHVLAEDANGLSDDIEDASSDDITGTKKRKRHSRATLDDCYDHSDTDNYNETSPQKNRGRRKNSLETHTNTYRRQ